MAGPRGLNVGLLTSTLLAVVTNNVTCCVVLPTVGFGSARLCSFVVLVLTLFVIFFTLVYGTGGGVRHERCVGEHTVIPTTVTIILIIIVLVK